MKGWRANTSIIPNTSTVPVVRMYSRGNPIRSAYRRSASTGTNSTVPMIAARSPSVASSA